mgnify:CR=1 FL=1
MKLKLAIYLSILFIGSYSTQITAQKTIQLTIKNIEKDSVMIAYYFGEKQYILGDENGNNTYIKFDKNGKGTFTGNLSKKGMYMLVFPPKNDYIDFLFDGKDLEISLDRKLMQKSISFKNSSANQLLYKYVSFLSNLSNEKEEFLNNKNNNIDKERLLKELDIRHVEFKNELVSNNMNNMAAKFLKASNQIKVPLEITNKKEQFEYYKANFFNTINFNDEWLIRTPFFYPKIMTYLDKLTEQKIDEIAKSIDYIIGLSVNNDEMYQYLVVTFLNKYAKSSLMIAENVYSHIVKKYYIERKATWIEDSQLTKIIATYNKSKNSLIGRKVDDFKIINNNNQTTSLYKTAAQYKILYFWQPPFNQADLKVSKEELPNNVAFLSISKSFNLKERDDFIAKYPQDFPLNILIEEDRLAVFESLNIYKTKTKPTVFLLDESNQIIAKRITVKQVFEMIDQLNNSKK